MLEISGLTSKGVEVLEHTDEHVKIKCFTITDQDNDFIASVINMEDAKRVVKRVGGLDIGINSGARTLQIKEESHFFFNAEEITKFETYLDERKPNDNFIANLPMSSL